jgi:hypothetical protein
MVDFFFEHKNEYWQAHMTSDLNHVAGTISGHLIYKGADRRMIFCSNPNPFMGRFQPRDLLTFANKAGFNNWDNNWVSALEKHGRLLVQTNLDAGMSIEPEPANARDNINTRNQSDWFERAVSLANTDEAALRRDFKFNETHCFCFTTSYA